MTTNTRKYFLGAACGIAMLASGGCNPYAKVGMKVVGKVVDDTQAKKLGEELMGKDAAAADAKLGQPLDVWRDTAASKEWRVYPIAMNVTGNERFVARLDNGKVVSIAKVSLNGGSMDVAKNLMLEQKVKGKTPKECEEALGMGAPVVTARSEKTNQTAQLYDASTVKGLGNPQYCRLKFDAAGHCTECKLVDVDAYVGAEPH